MERSFETFVKIFRACGIIIRLPVSRKTGSVSRVRTRIVCSSLMAVVWTLLLSCPKIVIQLLPLQHGAEPLAHRFETRKSFHREVTQWSMLARAFVALFSTAWHSMSLLSFVENGKRYEASCSEQRRLGQKRRASPTNVAVLLATLVFAGFNVYSCGEEIVALGQHRGDANFAVGCTLLLSQTASTLLVGFVIFQHERMLRAAMVVVADYADAELRAAHGIVGQRDTRYERTF